MTAKRGRELPPWPPQVAREAAESSGERRIPVPAVAPAPFPVRAVPVEPDEVRGARSRIVRTVLGSIGLGVVVLVASLVFDDADTDVARRLAIGMALTLALYAVVSLLVGRNLASAVIRPRLVEGPVGRAIAIGLACGVGAAIVVGGLVSLLSGEFTSDQDMVAVASERLWVPTIAIVFVAVVAAPVIEEVLFRGLLVESFRSRGRTSAILLGAVAFSFWHLNPAALRYYVVMGFLLGFLYWRFGLAGSISAHLAFNGVLAALAFASLLVGPEQVSRSGIAVEIPASWRVVDDTLAPGIDLAVESPTGAAVVLERIGSEQLAVRGFETSQMALTRLPDGAHDERAVTVDGGPAVRFALTLPGGTDSDVVVVPKGRGIFVLTLVDGGSDEAERRFGEMLASLRLPTL